MCWFDEQFCLFRAIWCNGDTGIQEGDEWCGLVCVFQTQLDGRAELAEVPVGLL